MPVGSMASTEAMKHGSGTQASRELMYDKKQWEDDVHKDWYERPLKSARG